MKKPEQAQPESSPFQIEQAIFTSATSAKSEGYHLVAVSPGVSEADRRELSIWGPSHDSLLESGHGALSVNFHALPGGGFCVSQTTLEGAEYSGRGPQVYTHSLIIPPAVFEQFGNNPFVLLREATAAGHVRIYSEPPERLKGFTLTGSFPAVDEELLTQLANQFGAPRLAHLVDAVLAARCLGVVAADGGPRLMAGLINCLPPEVRPHFSMSTALKHSPRRPFRVICAPTNEKEQRRLVRQYEVELFHVDHHPDGELRHSWSEYLLERFENGEFARFGQELGRPRPRLTVDGLETLATSLREGSDVSYFEAPRETQPATDHNSTEAPAATPVEAETSAQEPGGDESDVANVELQSESQTSDAFGDLSPALQVVDEAMPTPAEMELPEQANCDSTDEAFAELAEQCANADAGNAHEDSWAELAAVQETVEETAEQADEQPACENQTTDESHLDQAAEPASAESNDNFFSHNSGEPMSQQSTSQQAFQDETPAFNGDAFSPAAARKEPKPAFRLSRQCPEAAARLMRLEATVFEAMTGDESAREHLGPLWGEVQEKLGPEFQSQCREEFLHYAIHMWQHFSSDIDRNPLQAAAALDVVCRLFEEPQAALQHANA